MILVQKGQLLTSTATEDEVLFVELDENGQLQPAGRAKFDFSVVSGTVKVGVGKAIVAAAHADHTTTAQQNFSITLSQLGTMTEAAKEGGPMNLRIVGVGVVSVTW